jgi:hypothetical protein
MVDFITLVYYDPGEKKLRFNPYVDSRVLNTPGAIYAGDDGLYYAVVYYNDKHKVAFALRGNDTI